MDKKIRNHYINLFICTQCIKVSSEMRSYNEFYPCLGERRVPGHSGRGTARMSANHPENLALRRLPGYSNLMTPFSTRKLTKAEYMHLIGNTL